VSQYFEVHPANPQRRFLWQAAQVLQAGGIGAIPTDSSYALVCHLDDKAAVERLRRIRGVGDRHHLTLLCRDLSELASYARVDNRQYRLLKQATPGPYTFILEATREVPRRVAPHGCSPAARGCQAGCAMRASRACHTGSRSAGSGGSVPRSVWLSPGLWKSLPRDASRSYSRAASA